jgi:hypothetical protein
MRADTSAGSRIDQIWAEAIRLLKASVTMALVYFGLLTGLGIAIDVGVLGSGSELLLSILSLALGYLLIKDMILKGQVSTEPLRAGFGMYFGIAILSGLATLIGFVLLIVPAIILQVRWAPAYGYGLVEGQGVAEALGRSWESTRKHFVPILVSLIVPIGLFGVGMATSWFGSDDFGAIELIPSAISNSAMSASTVAGLAIGIAVYALLANPVGDVAEVFE